MPTTVSFNGVNAGGGSFVQAPEGNHVGSLSTWELTESRNGNKMIRAIFTVPLEDGRESSQYENFVLVPNALWKLKQFAIAAGLSDDALQGDIDIEQLMPELEGAQVVLDIRKKMDATGIERFNVDRISSLASLNGGGDSSGYTW